MLVLKRIKKYYDRIKISDLYELVRIKKGGNCGINKCSFKHICNLNAFEFKINVTSSIIIEVIHPKCVVTGNINQDCKGGQQLEMKSKRVDTRLQLVYLSGLFDLIASSAIGRWPLLFVVTLIYLV